MGVNGMKKDTCCFTGHRKIRKGDEAAIRAKIREQVLPLLDQGITDFMVGGAVGFDMLAAETLLDLREKEGKELRIISALPFLQWRKGWPMEAVEREDRILEKSDEILISAKGYSRQSYLHRDRRMVDASSVCIAYCTRMGGGTAYTVRYALRQGVPVVNIADWDIGQLAEDQGGLVPERKTRAEKEDDGPEYEQLQMFADTVGGQNLKMKGKGE